MNNRSVLRFDKYIVKTINFEINEEFLSQNKNVNLDFDIDAKSLSEGNRLIVELRAQIFKDAVKRGYPFEMNVVLKGYFSMVSEGKIDISIFETNAIAILFPYLRALVSSYTANANVTPVLLPAMNINEYIRRKLFYGYKRRNIWLSSG